MNRLRLRHHATHDRYGVRTTQPELLTCERTGAETHGIRIAIGTDPLTSVLYKEMEGEAATLADWILDELAK